jgi:LysR family nitrogen assimilation transcriptional regulator
LFCYIEIEARKLMNLTQLRYFVAVAKFKNLSKASEILGIAQPAISRQMKILEAELGASLLTRHTRGTELTDVGVVLLQRAEFILRTIDETRSQVLEYAGSPSGSLRIGCPPALCRILLARPLNLFMSRYKNVRVEVRESISEELCRGVLTDQLDLAIISTWTEEPFLTISPLFSEKVWLFGKAGKKKVPKVYSLEAVAKLPLLVGRGQNTTRQLVERRAALSGLSLQILLETDSVHIIEALLMEGIGYAAAPYSALMDLLKSGAVSGAPIRDLNLSRSIIRRTDRPISLAATEFLSLIQKEVNARTLL